MRQQMFNIKIEKNALKKVNLYVTSYRNYFEEMYYDSGIWQEEQIIQNYYNDSEERYFQILNSIEKKLSNGLISYLNNQAIIRWRSKILLVSFKDEGDMRIITDLEIR